MPVSSPNRILLVDGFNLVRRLYEANPDADKNIDAVVISAGRSLQRALRNDHPSHAVVVFECHDTTWRHLLYAEYKAGRKPTPAPLLAAIPDFEQEFRKSGVGSMALANYEADDVIATLATGIASSGGSATILSTDKSFLQLIGRNVRVVDHFKQSEYRQADVMAKQGVKISQLTDYWAMSGDTSNNIKGVPGVGKKTAADLLARFESLEDILSSSEDDKKVQQVQSEADVAIRCKQLVTLKLDVALGINLKSFRVQPVGLP